MIRILIADDHALVRNGLDQWLSSIEDLEVVGLASNGREAVDLGCELLPDIVLMDEPFGALDEMTRERLNLELLRIWDASGSTIVFVTHSIPEAVYLSTKIVVMSPRPGRIADVIESTLPKERPLEIRDTPEFMEIAHRVRDGLREGHADG